LNEQGELAGILRIVLQGLAGAGAVVVAGGLGVYLVLRARRKRSAPGPASYDSTVPAHSSSPVDAAAPLTAGTLVCTAGPLRGQDFAVGQGVSIGRDATWATIVIDDRQVSGQHVWVGPLDGRIVARDYGSTNGTFLNGDLVNRVTELALHDGDVLTLGGQGSVKFTFRKP
jgi:FHA domain-containing protein